LSLFLGLVVAATQVSACFADPAPAATAPAAATSVPGVHLIVLFPASVDTDASSAGANAAVALDTAKSALDVSIKWRLTAGSTYSVKMFNKNLPQVQRALDPLSADGSLSSSDVQLPITSPYSGQRIAKLIGGQGYLMEEIASFQQDPASQKVTVGVSGSLYLTADGSVARTFAETGSATPDATGSDSTSAVIQRAVDAAAAKIANDLGAQAGSSSKNGIPNSRIGGSSAGAASALMIVAAAALLGIIAHNVSTHGNAGTANTAGNGTGGGAGSVSGSNNPPTPPS
jgi:hypothetical protein